MPIATNWITAFMLCLALENESWDLIGHFAIHLEQSNATLLHSTEFLQCHVTCVTPSRGKKRLITKIKTIVICNIFATHCVECYHPLKAPSR